MIINGDNILYLNKFFDHIDLPKSLVRIMLASSLTKEFKKNKLPFSVKISFLGEKEIYFDELQYFNNKSSKFYVREVYLSIGDLKVVRSRSICYLNNKYWIDILNNKNSLGEYLFRSSNNISRSEIDFFWIDKDYPLLSTIKLTQNKKIISRRSSFFTNFYNSIDNKLLLTECFLENLVKLYK